jgi:hypothetical protein
MHNATYALYDEIVKSILNFFQRPLYNLRSDTASDCIMHRVISYRLLTAGARFRSQASESRICGR